MYIVWFYGYVLPKAVQPAFEGFSNVTWDIPELGISHVDFYVRIKEGQISVECHTPSYVDDDLAFFYRCAYDICRARIDLIGLRQGLGVSVILDSFIDPNGTRTYLQFIHPDISNQLSCLKNDANLDRLSSEAIRDHTFGQAIHDFMDVISTPHISAVNCARAVEALRNLVAPEADKKGRRLSWDRFRAALNVDEDYLKLITSYSEKHRHGDWAHVDGEKIAKIVNRAAIILNRYLELRLRNGEKLPKSEYPQLHD